MRFLAVLALILPALFAQPCVPGRVLPAGSVSGSLDGSSCSLSDSTPYDSYRLDLPVRGQIRFELNASADFILLLRDARGAQLAAGPMIQRPVEAGSYTLLVNGR